jgi:hypothetical protein
MQPDTPKLERWYVAYGRRGNTITAPMSFHSEEAAEQYAQQWRDDGYYAAAFRAEDE